MKYHTIRKTIYTALLLVLMFSCGNNDNKRDQLAEYKMQLSTLKKEITALENEIENEGGAENDLVNVEVEELQLQSYNHYIDVVGKVLADENTVVSAEGPGKITRIAVKEGDHVREGQVLAYLNNDAIESQIAQVKAQLQLATTTFERRKKLCDMQIGSEIEYLQAKANKETQMQNLKALEAQLNMLTVKSQIDGVVDEIFQKSGEIAGPSIPFARVVNIGNIHVTADVGERYVGAIKSNDSTEIYIPALDSTIDATIFRSATVINDVSRTFKVRINLENKDHRVKPNLISKVKLKVYSADRLLIVPSILVKQDFEGDFLFVVEQKDGKTIAKKAYVKSIFDADNKTIISEGLKAGDNIVTEGYTQVVNGTQVKVTNSQ